MGLLTRMSKTARWVQRCVQQVCLMASPLLVRHFLPEAEHSFSLAMGLLWRKCAGLMTRYLWGKDLLRTSRGTHSRAQSRTQIAASYLTDLLPRKQKSQLRTSRDTPEPQSCAERSSGENCQAQPGHNSWRSRPGAVLLHMNPRRHHSTPKFPKG